MTSLVIVESEAKAKALSEQSGGAHETLLLRSAPMKVNHHLNAVKLFAGETGFQFVPAEAEMAFARDLLTNLYKDIYVALESDQRGEYWSWMLSKFVFAASKGEKGIRRVHIAGFGEEELAEAFRLVEPVQDSAAAAFYIRSLFNSCLLRHLSRLVGTVNGPGGLPLNFAALTALFLLEEREAEVDAFSAPAKWQIVARVSTPSGAVKVRLQEAYGITDDGFFRDQGEVKKALALFEGRPLAVIDVAESDFTIEPPMPYRLAELLHDGYIHLGMGPAKVLQALQKFHAGLPIDGRQTGLISAPFAVIPLPYQVILPRIRKEVSTIFGSGELIERQPNGHVILPLLPGLAGNQLQDVLPANERQLYDLIRDRALASQMPEAVGRNLLMECAAGGCLFQGRSPLLTEKGFLKAFAKGYDLYLLPDCPLQDLQVGQELTVEQVIPEQSTGVTAEYYSFDSFCEDLAEFALPLESVLILMLQEMLDKKYLAIDARGGFHIEGNAGKVVATLNRAFPAMKGINFSAYFEQTVGEVVSGRKSLDFALKQFDQNFIMHGVPLVKIQVPRAVPVREKKSKNIIKSPEPESRMSGPTAESAMPPAVEMADFRVIQEPSLGENLIGETQAAATDEDTLQVEAPQRLAEMMPEMTMAAAQPREKVEVDEVRPSSAESASQVEMPDEEETAPPEKVKTVVAAVTEAVEPEMPEMQEAEQGTVFEEPLPVAEESGQQAAELMSVEAAVDAPAPAEAPQGRSCPDCGKPLMLKSDRFGRYLVCSGYPACRHAESYEPGQQKMDLPCPLCGQESLVVKRTPTGKELYVCPGEGCEFMAWSRPHAVTCPGCGFPFLVEKKTAAGRTVLRCPRAGCSYQQTLDGAQMEGEGAKALQPARKKVLVRRSAGSSGGTGRKKVLVRRKKA
ncbi:MAG: topoisomerase DNA-binding C4 zinc finger domain-containing protein [Proteobacteria bacterium]|nr:topoisomerase DNA-binding C4 zinc finger domain-containing protein [Pseudomonadota bacterium]MBU4294373.1 topoisomerase DNA-binding C4 zinc finger domain-containing protein [Pseudomonadota bacterium]MCG2749439.1 DNA topoisomerase [Desulfobulbaceae bacterium]